MSTQGSKPHALQSCRKEKYLNTSKHQSRHRDGRLTAESRQIYHSPPQTLWLHPNHITIRVCNWPTLFYRQYKRDGNSVSKNKRNCLKTKLYTSRCFFYPKRGAALNSRHKTNHQGALWFAVTRVAHFLASFLEDVPTSARLLSQAFFQSRVYHNNASTHSHNSYHDH